jgi:hypothetical protein
MLFNATFNNISVKLWWSVLLVEETGGPIENRKLIILNLLENNKYKPSILFQNYHFFLGGKS